MNWKTLKTTAESINLILTPIAIVSTGLWAILTFHSEKKAEKAEKELAALNREVIEVAVTSKMLPQIGNKYLAQIQVTVQNNGKTDVRIPVNDYSLRITRIDTTSQLPEQPKLKRVQYHPLPLATNLEGEPSKIEALSLPSGGNNSLLYLAKVEQGRFLVEFSAQRMTKKEKSYENDELAASEILDVYEQLQDGCATLIPPTH